MTRGILEHFITPKPHHSKCCYERESSIFSARELRRWLHLNQGQAAIIAYYCKNKYKYFLKKPETKDTAYRSSRIHLLTVPSTKYKHHSKVLLNSFPMNGHTLGFCP